MGRQVNVFGGPTIPQPLVQELPQEGAWDEWNKAVETHEAKFAPTAPSPLATAEPAPLEPQTLADLPDPVPVTVTKSAGPTLHDLLNEARRDNRVCLQPGPWTKLYVLLAQYRSGSARLPPPPLVGPAWDKTPSLAKKMSFHSHLEWASMHGCLQPVYDFIKGMPDDQWHCGR